MLEECCNPGGHYSDLVQAGTTPLRSVKLSTAADSSSENEHHTSKSSTHYVLSIHLTCWSLLPLSLGWCFLWSIPPTRPLSCRASVHEVAEPSGEANRPGPERETGEETWNSALSREGVSNANTPLKRTAKHSIQGMPHYRCCISSPTCMSLC